MNRSLDDVATLAGRIAARHPLMAGLIVKMPNLAAVEAAGRVGFDLVVVDTEHGSGDTADLEHHLRAAGSVGVDVLVRVGANDSLQILRALDAGANGVIVPHVDSATDARAAVTAAHYPPLGGRGLATSTRSGWHSTAPLREHLERARRETVVVAQLEDARAVPVADAIAATEGINAVWLGPSDLSMSLGHPGDLANVDVATAVDGIVDSVRAADAAALCVIADDEVQAEYWVRRGASIVLFSLTTLVARRIDAVVTHMRQLTGVTRGTG